MSQNEAMESRKTMKGGCTKMTRHVKKTTLNVQKIVGES